MADEKMYAPLQDLFAGKYCKPLELKVDEWTSGTVYYRVKSVDVHRQEVNCIDCHGQPLAVGFGIMSSEMISASQYDKEEKVTRTEMVEKLVNAGSHVFTVTFRKQLTAEDVQHVLDDEKFDTQQPATKKRKTCDRAIKSGEMRSLTGFLCNTEHLMGRSNVIDLNESGAYKQRQVDHRTVETLILQRVKYILK